MSIVNKVLKKYNKLPIWLTNMIAPVFYLIPENVRYGKVYRKEKAELERISTLTPDEVEAEKNASLRKLIHYAYAHVPYYHKLFDENGIVPDDIQTETDLCKIPFLTKELLVKNRDALISDEFKKADLIYLTTSGSTGTPTGFYVQKESPMREWVYCLHMLAPFGKKPGDSKLVMRGKSFWAQSKGKCWQWDAFRRELSINIFEMTPENMEQYCRAIEKYKPDFAYGYPSAMYLLCKYISGRQGGLQHQFKGFEAISEATLPEQREFIEKTINAKVFSFYGMSERVVIATNTPDFDGYEIQPMYGIAEIVDENGDVINKSDTVGEIVGTGLLNYGMPLIRYKTGDMSSWASDDSLCGIEGRWNHDILIGNDNCIITMTALNVHSAAFDHVIRYQLYQDTRGKVEIHIVPSECYTEEDGNEIVREYSKKTGKQLQYEVVLEEKIEPNPNGKLPLVVQKIHRGEKDKEICSD